MKLNGKFLVVAAMVVGVLGSTGCSKANSDDAIAPEETAANAPVDENNDADSAQSSFRLSFYGGRHYYAPHAPPAARYETYGRAPSARHFWAPGYYRWNGRQHVWVGGRWETRRYGYTYVSPRWERSYSRWEYVPGHWRRV